MLVEFGLERQRINTPLIRFFFSTLSKLKRRKAIMFRNETCHLKCTEFAINSRFMEQVRLFKCQCRCFRKKWEFTTCEQEQEGSRSIMNSCSNEENRFSPVKFRKQISFLRKKHQEASNQVVFNKILPRIRNGPLSKRIFGREKSYCSNIKQYFARLVALGTRVWSTVGESSLVCPCIP